MKLQLKIHRKDIPQLSSPVQTSSAALSAAQVRNVASRPNNTYKSSCEANTRIQHTYKESGSCWRDVYPMEEQLTWHDSTDDITLSDVFLHDYYSQKASCAAARQAAWDCLLEYNYEGVGSPAGSVDYGISLLECDEDLQFLDDLGPKFKKLAEVCSPPTPQTPQKSSTIPEFKKADVIAESSLKTKPDRNQNVSMAQSSSSHRHGHKSTSVMGFNEAAFHTQRQTLHNTRSMFQSLHVSPVSQTMLPSPGHMLLLQEQPVFYTTTPVMQPMHYIVQPQLQRGSVLLAEAPVTNLQGMILLNGSPENIEHILHWRNTAGTITLRRTKGNAMVDGIQGIGIRQRSDGSGEGMSVRKGRHRIRSEGGAGTELCSSGRLLHVGEAGSAEEQRVFT